MRFVVGCIPAICLNVLWTAIALVQNFPAQSIRDESPSTGGSQSIARPSVGGITLSIG
jgi:hypothetical protein